MMPINSNTEWLPGVSQFKSIFEFVGRDSSGAINTQKQFLRRCPIISQAAAGIGIGGNTIEQANKETITIFGQLTNSMPIIGHLKGCLHYIRNDTESAVDALLGSTRSAAIIVAGYFGKHLNTSTAVGASIVAGISFDLVGTAIAKKPVGVILSVKNAINYPSPGCIFDAIVVPFADGLSGGLIPTNLVPQSLIYIAPVTVVNSISTPLIEEPAPIYFDDEKTESNIMMKKFLGSEYEFGSKESLTISFTEHSETSSSPCRDMYIPDASGDHMGDNNGNSDVNDSGLTDMDAETVLNFITSPIEMVDPMTNKTIKPLVSMVELPQKYFEFTSVIKIKTIHRGALNIVLRHAHQLDKIVPHFAIDDLPTKPAKVIRYLQKAPDMKAKEYLQTLEKMIENDKSLYVKTIKMQLTLLEFLTEHMTEEDYLGEIIDRRGRSRSVWRVLSKNNQENAIVTFFGSYLHKPDNYIVRPFREIVSFQFMSYDEAKKNASLPKRKLR